MQIRGIYLIIWWQAAKAQPVFQEVFTSMIYVLFDNPSKIAFVTDAITAPYEVMNISGEKGPFLKKIFSCCRKCAKKAKSGDTIICWLDMMAVFCHMLTGKKDVRIIAINILLKEKKSFKNLIFRKLYRDALNSDRVVATVTAKEYGDYLNKLLNIDRKYILLHDAYNPTKLAPKEDAPAIQKVPGTVFCGGRNGRDWDMAMRIAKAMPEVTFNFVMPGSVYKTYKRQLTDGSLKNVSAFVDVPKKKFTEIMDSSELVVMPLDSQSPSGLLVFYEATARGKMIITSDTVTTREYFSEGRGVLCDNNVENWVREIKYHLAHPDETAAKNESCKQFLSDNCSVKQFQTILRSLL